MADWACAAYGSAPRRLRLRLECPMCGAYLGTVDEDTILGMICRCGNDTFRAVKE